MNPKEQTSVLLVRSGSGGERTFLHCPGGIGVYTTYERSNPA